MPEQSSTTKAQLLADINAGWATLNAVLEQLGPAELTGIKDAHGWTVKDHLIHLSAWERSAVFFLQGKPRAEGLRIDDALYMRGDDDEMNEVIFEQTRDMPLDDALAQLHEIHHELLDALQPLSDADINKPYRAFLPDEPGEGDGPRAYAVIDGNSGSHFREHLGWIEAMVKGQ